MPAPQHTLEIAGTGASLQAYPGELILLTGEAGSGKSLWLERLAGLKAAPGNISIRMDGKPYSASPPRNIRMLFDRWPTIWLGQHVREELNFGLAGRLTEAEMNHQLAVWGIAELSLNDDLERLNRLQSIRLSLAAISLAAPRLVLLDNPTASLPEQDAGRICNDVAGWARKSNLIVVVACNRWHDWQAEATQRWCINTPDDLPQSGVLA